MIDYKYADLFKQDSNKQLQIEFDDITITNTDIYSEQFELNEAICSESELKFGCCETSTLKFKVSSIYTSLKGKWVTVKEILDGNSDEPFQFGRYKVDSEKLSGDRRYRDIVAYDAMYDILEAEVSDWYNTILPDSNSKVTMKQFRNSFFDYFGIEQEDVSLPNDDNMIVERTISPSELSGKTVITAICEINGCFGHMGRDGKFQYIFLKEIIDGLYPSDTLYPRDDLYPRDEVGTAKISNGNYISVEYEDFDTQKITKLQIRQEENDIGCVVGTDGNCYIIENNFLVYGMGADELEKVAKNVFEVIKAVWYKPATIEATGNPCLEVGDGIRLIAPNDIIYTYILKRTLKGILSHRDEYVSEGVETYSEDANGVNSSIIQLKGKTNVLERTVEETKSTITDVEKGLQTQITQTAEDLRTEAKNTKEGLETSISQNAQKIEAEAKRAKESENTISESVASISLSCDRIGLAVAEEQQRAESAEQGLESSFKTQIELTSQKIQAEITAKTQTWDTRGYDVAYREDKDPDIEAEAGKYWLNTQNGKLYVRAAVAATWEYLGRFHSNTLADGDSAGEHRWFYVGTGESIWRKYGDRPGFNMEKYGGFKPSIHVDYGQPVGSWWLEIEPKTEGLYIIGDYLSDLNTSNTDDYMELWEKLTNSYAEWQYVKTCDVIDITDMFTEINISAAGLDSKVSKGEVVSEINQSADKISMTASRLELSSDNFEIKEGVIKSKDTDTKQYIKLDTGGLEGGYGSTKTCEIVCSSTGLAFRGKVMKFCMNEIQVGTSMDATKTNKAYTGDIAYVAPIDGKTDNLNAATLHVWNGLVLDNGSYSA